MASVQGSYTSKEQLTKEEDFTRRQVKQCVGESETAVHALWECAMLDKIWEVVPSFEDRRQYAISNTRDLISVFHKKRKNLELMAIVMWTIWHLRN